MSSSLNATVAFTLPISCQICLAKVKEPVCCDNNHVYCKACIVIWTSKSKHCPTCRVPITSEKPYRQLLGGQDNHGTESNFSQPMVRKARMKSIFNSYEEEIERLTSCICKLKEENDRLSSGKDLQLIDHTPNVLVTARSTEVSSVKEELAEVTARCSQVTQSLNKSLQENAELKVANESLSRENDRMRYELSQRTPSKVGRFTVATLETQIDRQKKEIAGLERALALSDKHIEGLRAQLKGVSAKPQLHQSGEDDAQPLSDPTHSLPRALFSDVTVAPPTALQKNRHATASTSRIDDSSCNLGEPVSKIRRADEDICKPVDQMFPASTNLQPPQVLSCTTRPNDLDRGQGCSSTWKGSPVSQLLASGLTSSANSTTSDITSSRSNSHNYDLGSPSKFKHTLSPSKVQLFAEKPSEAETGIATDRSPETDSMFEGIEATDISMTAEYSDCLRILHKAEKRVKEKHHPFPS